MYYELGTMVCIRKDASPFVNHEKGIGYPRFDVIGEIVCIHPTILSYTVCLSKKFTLTFYQDDIYELPDCISSRHDIFHKIISFDKVNQPFYYPKEFESFVNEDKYCEHDVKASKEVYAMFNKIPKYSVNDIVIIGNDFSSYESGIEQPVNNIIGVINDVYNHRDTGEVFYHIIFNSGTPRKFFEYEIGAKFNTDKFKDGQSIHKQLLAKMYHTRSYIYLSEKEVLEWAHANFEENVDYTIYCPHSDRPAYYNYRYDPKFMENMMYPVKSSLTALEELNRREFERIAASPIRIDIDDAIKANYSIEEIKKMINKDFGVSGTYTWNLYKKIIFNGPCTIILWTDGTKTIAKTSSDEEIFDPEKGVAICFMKKMLGHTETNKILRKASEQYKEYIAENRPSSSLDEFIDFCKDYFKSETKSVNHIDQSTIEEVKKVEEQDD